MGSSCAAKNKVLDPYLQKPVVTELRVSVAQHCVGVDVSNPALESPGAQALVNRKIPQRVLSLDSFDLRSKGVDIFSKLLDKAGSGGTCGDLATGTQQMMNLLDREVIYKNRKNIVADLVPSKVVELDRFAFIELLREALRGDFKAVLGKKLCRRLEETQEVIEPDDLFFSSGLFFKR